MKKLLIYSLCCGLLMTSCTIPGGIEDGNYLVTETKAEFKVQNSLSDIYSYEFNGYQKIDGQVYYVFDLYEAETPISSKLAVDANTGEVFEYTQEEGLQPYVGQFDEIEESAGISLELVYPHADDTIEAFFENMTAAGVQFPSMLEDIGEALHNMYGLEDTDIEYYEILIPLMNVQATEYAVFKPAEGKNQVVLDAINARQEQLSQTWENYLPEQKALVDNSKVIEKDGYIYFFVSEYADDIEEMLNNNELTQFGGDLS